MDWFAEIQLKREILTRTCYLYNLNILLVDVSATEVNTELTKKKHVQQRALYI